MSTNRVVICDDHEIVREALRAQLDAQEDLEVVGEAGDSKGVLPLVLTHRPDLLVLDIELPDSDGVVVISRLLGEVPDLRIMVFSAHEQSELIALVAESGACGFVGKSESTSGIVPAAKAILAGGRWFPEGFSEEGGPGASEDKDELRRLRSLTLREREILDLFASGMRARGVAEKIGIRPATVYTHVRNAIHKLDVDSRTQAVTIATRYSFLHTEPEAGEED